MTTVIGCVFLTSLASRRDFATGSYTCGSHSSSMNGLPSVSVMNRRSSGKGGEFISALQFGNQAELRNGEWAELHFESDDALGGSFDRAAHGSGALFLLYRRGNSSKHAEQERAGADRRVG